MKVGEFCKTIDVGNHSYNRFIHQEGPIKGTQSDVYMEAFAYFKKREIAGIPLPTANSKRANTDSSSKKDHKNGEKESESSPKGKTSSSSSGPNKDFLHIGLPGEPTDSVPVYDTCDDVRRKVSAWLREPKVTQAQFCRDLHAQMHTDEKKGASVSANSLQSFRGHSGPVEGGDSKVFYAAYVFFEKKRVAEGKAKTKKREEVEKVWPGGVDLEKFGVRRYVFLLFIKLFGKEESCTDRFLSQAFVHSEPTSYRRPVRQNSHGRPQDEEDREEPVTCF